MCNAILSRLGLRFFGIYRILAYLVNWIYEFGRYYLLFTIS